jgi:hypothetical protein
VHAIKILLDKTYTSIYGKINIIFFFSLGHESYSFELTIKSAAQIKILGSWMDSSLQDISIDFSFAKN